MEPRLMRRITKYPYPSIFFAYDRSMTFFSVFVLVCILWGTL